MVCVENSHRSTCLHNGLYARLTYVTRRTKDSDQKHSRVKAVIAGRVLAGTVSLEAVARQLGTSPRTLQRRLNRRGICFWALVEQSRFEIAGGLVARHGAAGSGDRHQTWLQHAGRVQPCLHQMGGVYAKRLQDRSPRHRKRHAGWREMGRNGTHRSVGWQLKSPQTFARGGIFRRVPARRSIITQGRWTSGAHDFER